jgi:hypothetical protein
VTIEDRDRDMKIEIDSCQRDRDSNIEDGDRVVSDQRD